MQNEKGWKGLALAKITICKSIYWTEQEEKVKEQIENIYMLNYVRFLQDMLIIKKKKGFALYMINKGL